MSKRKAKRKSIIKYISYYMGMLFYFSAGTLAKAQSKFALVMCLISVTWLVSVILDGSHVFDEENSEKKAVAEHVDR